jgi:CheY-like chemotaxis protein
VHVLIIDDDRDTTDLLQVYFDGRGWEVRTAHNGREGIRLAAELLPDVVVTDYRMPVEDGCDVVAELRANDKTARVPIILFTAAARPGVPPDLCGADACVAKPANPELLYDIIRQVASTSMLPAESER